MPRRGWITLAHGTRVVHRGDSRAQIQMDLYQRNRKRHRIGTCDEFDDSGGVDVSDPDRCDGECAAVVQSERGGGVDERQSEYELCGSIGGDGGVVDFVVPVRVGFVADAGDGPEWGLGFDGV